ncbi:MAG TPA: hypothetical protein VE567_02870 [Sphingomonas sp.]|nr:hypothetical protein [Sphingomonas sp.]
MSEILQRGVNGSSWTDHELATSRAIARTGRRSKSMKSGTRGAAYPLMFALSGASIFNGLTPDEYRSFVMLKGLMLASAVAIAAPALAQTAAPASTNAAQPVAAATPPAAAATPAAPSDPTTATTAAPATSATPATQATPAASAQKGTNPASAVAAVVESDWTKYDADGNGTLSKAEFAAWMAALREQSPAQKAAVKDPAAWTAAAFAKADKDKSGTLSKGELEGFLKG